MIWRLLTRWRSRGRDIFRFHDGIRYRRADPLASYRALYEHPKFDWGTHPKLIEAGDLNAIKITAGAVRDVFHVPTFEQGGLAEHELIAVLMAFTEYCEGVKKNGCGQPILPQPTDSLPSGPSVTNADSVSI